MKIHITNLYGQLESSVAQIAQNMVRDIAATLNIREIGVYSFNADSVPSRELSIRFDGMNASISHGDIVIFQSPTWNGTRFDLEYIKRLKLYENIKIAVFIHDVIPLMFSSNYYLMKDTISLYNMADVLIVPSEKMLSILRKEGLTVDKIIIQEMWDNTTDIKLGKPNFNNVINFSGSPKRFNIVNSWSINTKLKVFSKDFDVKNNNVDYEGWYDNSELLIKLNKNGGFGLVWEQSWDSEYYTTNVSFKLSTYLAAGIPVIVPKKLSNSHLIEEYGLGIVVESIEEVQDIIENLTDNDYNSLVNNVFNFRELLVQGFFTKKILIDTIHAILTKK